MSAAVEPDDEAGQGWRLARVSGVPVYVSPSWLLLAAFVVFAYAPSVQDGLGLSAGAAYLAAASFAVLLLGSTLAHELGHCLAGRALGLPVRRVRIFVLGGSSDLGRNPATPAGEYLVAMAGPLVSLVLACAGWSLAQLTERDTLAGELVRQIAWANTLITAFNLLPALPLDGGRVLRAGVWRLTGNAYRGSVAGAWGGRVLAVLLVVLALRGAAGDGGALGAGNVLLGLWLAVFLWIGATAVLRSAQVSDRLAGVSAAALTRRALPVDGDLPLAEALRRAGEAGAGGLVVVDGAGRPDGLVSEAAVQATPLQRRPWVTVGSLARRIEPGLVLRGDLAGEDFLAALRAMPAPEYLVVDAAGSPVGVLAAADVARTLSGRRP